MKGGLGRDLVIYVAGLVLGYLFAARGGVGLVRALRTRMPAVDVGSPAVALALIAVGIVALVIISRRGKK
jgi:multisubunit Na+/H+ antiporter MnhG subunit